MHIIPNLLHTIVEARLRLLLLLEVATVIGIM